MRKTRTNSRPDATTMVLFQNFEILTHSITWHSILIHVIELLTESSMGFPKQHLLGSQSDNNRRSEDIICSHSDPH
jgi:hypothetical protein